MRLGLPLVSGAPHLTMPLPCDPYQVGGSEQTMRVTSQLELSQEVPPGGWVGAAASTSPEGVQAEAMGPASPVRVNVEQSAGSSWAWDRCLPPWHSDWAGKGEAPSS